MKRGPEEVIPDQVNNYHDAEVEDQASSGEFVVIMKFLDKDKHVLKCPVELYEQHAKSEISTDETEIRVNYPRGLLVMTTKTEEEAKRILQMKKFGDLEVDCRWARDLGVNCGVIGRIPCPSMKETKERKIELYKEVLRKNGTPVSSIEWINQKVWKRGVKGYTTQLTEFLKLEFVKEAPTHVYLGHCRYEVKDYVADAIQCWNCQNFGHISKNCRSQPACVKCGSKGHRKSDNRCGTRRVRCANCEGDHPASYRGCVAFLREKEAMRIRGKEKTPLHNARRLASAKEFPHLQRARVVHQPVLSQSPEATPRHQGAPSGGRAYASAVATGPSPRTGSPQPPAAGASANSTQSQPSQTVAPTPTNQGAQPKPKINHSCTCKKNGKALEKKLNNILKKNGYQTPNWSDTCADGILQATSGW